jgi:ribosome-associated translation inhibitor RaiA
MKIPLEITYRDVDKSDILESLIHEKADKLKKFCSYFNSCRVAIEMPTKRRTSGNSYLVRINLTVPPGHEILVRQEIQEGEVSDPLSAAVRSAFDTAGRRLQEFVERQRDEVKSHPEQEVNDLVSDLDEEKD